MGRPVRSLITALAVGFLALAGWALLRRPAPEPSYGAKPLSDWLIQLEDSDNHVERDYAASAVRHIGTNGIPTLLRMMRSKESPITTELLAWRHGWYSPFDFFSPFLNRYIFGGPSDIVVRAQAGFIALGPSAATAVPELSKILDQNLSAKYTSRTVRVLGKIGPAAKAAVRSLLRAAASTNNGDHYDEFVSIGEIHAEPDSVVPFLIGVMSNVPADRMYAVHVLGQFGGAAKSAVPSLLALLSDPNFKSDHQYGYKLLSDRDVVERALEQIDPVTYAQVATNTAPAAKP